MNDMMTNDVSETDIVRYVTVNNNSEVTANKNVTKDDESIKNSNGQNTACDATGVNDIEKLDMKTYMFLNCLTCNITIENHGGNIIPCTVCNVNMVLKCYLCNDYVNIVDEVKNHIRIHMANNGDYIKCFKCLKSIPKAYITAHLPFCERQIVLFSCKICYFQTRSNTSLIIHALNRHAVFINWKECYGRLFKAFGKRRRGKIFQCEVCPYNTNRDSCLSGHIIRKHRTDSVFNVMKFINETYNYKLDGSSAVEQQYISDLNGAKKATNSEIDVQTYMFLNCLICDYTIKEHSGNIIPCPDCNMNMVLKCYLCNDHVNTADEIKNHIRIHMANNGDDIKCFKCLKSIPKAYMTAHLPLCKRQVVVFFCKFCDFKTRYNASLIMHALWRHAECINLNERNVILFKSFGYSGTGKRRKENIFQCEICPFITKFPKSLSKHIISMHHADNVYNVMEFINETYNTYLDGHSAAVQQRISTKEKSKNTRAQDNTSSIYRYCPSCKKLKKDHNTKKDNQRCKNCTCIMQYKCIKCGNLEIRYSNLLYHMNFKCNIRRWYNCNSCNYKTPSKYSMNKHVKLHENSVDNQDNGTSENADDYIKLHCNKCNSTFEKGIKEKKCDKCETLLLWLCVKCGINSKFYCGLYEHVNNCK